MSDEQKKDDTPQPSDAQNAGTARGTDEQAKVDAINRGDLDAALDASDRQQAAMHPSNASGTANASGTPNVGTASGSQKLNP